MKTALISHPNSVLHVISEYHPERPQRIAAVEDALAASGMNDFLLHKQARQAARSELIKVHQPAYVDWIFENAPTAEGERVQIDGDTAMNQYSLIAALTASGASLDAVDGVVDKAFENAFCLVRPPGHHAERAVAMGFCLFDSVAVAAQYAMDKYGYERVAIVDFDVHHGNGTEDIFIDEQRVLFCSTFQEYIFPGKYAPSQPGHIVNVPLPGGTDGEMYRRVFSEKVLPELDAFKPDFVFISAGFDAHKDDPLAGLNLEAEDFGWITRQIMQIADTHCDGRIVSTLEGGYDLDGLAQSALAHVSALMRLDQVDANPQTFA